MSWTTITDADELTALIGTPSFRAANKDRSTLHSLDRDWLSKSPFALVATADENGRCDVSPKGDPPGQLVHVIDDTTIALAERPGNKRMDGYRNVLVNPYVGLNFFVPGRGDTLRINGRASLVTDAPFFDDLVVKGHRPILCLVVDIEQIFHHCAKAFLRSRLWEPETWNPSALPSVAVMTKTLIPQAPESIAELETYYGKAYEEGLYR
ncbi:phosphohydrolase [Rhodococcoides trifolii]|uniref:Phosphohydrolase n=1 Tax=Rhodococcoides trifolii TaxID=908250 RepID=A0A917LFH3_9NOCA|nr:MSMEG_1061 family FMN-dependent PPOX-type flavoprotein [Rhodococcus trifolii]GGG18716.1 phosphohydrolase [Rhodococcus trifolii]